MQSERIAGGDWFAEMPRVVVAKQVHVSAPNQARLHWLCMKDPLEDADLPSLMTCGTSVSDTIHPQYTPGLFRASRDMVFLGVLSLRTRHGRFPAAAVQCRSEVFIVALTFDLCAAECDVFNTSEIHSAMIGNHAYLELYQSLLRIKTAEAFCDSSSALVPLPATSFALISNNAAMFCFEELDINFVSEQTHLLFTVMVGGCNSSRKIDISMGSPNYTIVLQRTCIGMELAEEAKLALHRAPIDALKAFAKTPGWLAAPVPASTSPISSVVNRTVLPVRERYEIDSSARLRPYTNNRHVRFAIDTGRESFVLRLAFLLCRDQECRLVREYTSLDNRPMSSFFDAAGGWIEPLRAVQTMFHPVPNFVVKCDHLTHAYLITSDTGVEICLNEAHRLLNRHGNLVGVDLHRNELFKGFSTFGPNMVYSLSETLLSALFSQPKTPDSIPSASSMLEKMERVVEGFAK